MRAFCTPRFVPTVPDLCTNRMRVINTSTKTEPSYPTDGTPEPAGRVTRGTIENSRGLNIPLYCVHVNTFPSTNEQPGWVPRTCWHNHVHDHVPRGAPSPRRCRARVNGALLLQLQWPWHHPAQSGECRVCCADRIVDCALVIAGKIAGRTHSQRRRSPRSTVKLSLAMEGILERRVLALEILERLGSASRRLPLELENLQGAGCRVQGAGCRVQGAGCRVQGAPLELEHLQGEARSLTHECTPVHGRGGLRALCIGRLSRAARPSAGSHAGRRRCPKLTRTPPGLRRVRTGSHAYQPPALGTYRTHRVPCLQGPTYCTYGIRVPASGVGHVPHTVATQAASGTLRMRHAAARARQPPRHRSRPAAREPARGDLLARSRRTRLLPHSAAR